MNFDPTVEIYPEQGHEEQILAWMEELARPSMGVRETVLECQLSTALERFMGIERDVLTSLLRANHCP